MGVKYLCKERLLNKSLGGYIEKGDVVNISYTPTRKVVISSVGLQKCHMKISPEVLYKNFILYDEIEQVDAWSVLNILANKFSNSPSHEDDIISEMRWYINKRKEFLRQCATEDTQQEQSSTETLHTINQ